MNSYEPSPVEFKEGQKVRNPASKIHPNSKWLVTGVYRTRVKTKKLNIGDIWAIGISDSRGKYSVTSLNGLKDFIIC